MWDAALGALGSFLDPSMLLFLIIGVVAGLAIGVIPGLGGTGAVAVLLPFVFILDPPQAMALIIGAVAVVHTADAVTSLLIGIPGSAAAATLLLDGHQLAKKGQGARALSASFLSSMLGGLIGVVALTLAIPIARPLVMALGSPEIFMLTVLGVSLTAMLSKGHILKGLIAGVFGILLAQIGGAPTSPEYRFTFGSLYLTEGLGLVAVALGIFGVAEVMALVARKQAISTVEGIGSGWIQGIRDVLKYWFHVVRGAFTGVVIGILPGVGATAGAWMAYGQAQATARGDDRKNFGKGDPRGVIGPSSASNSIEAGALIPTLLFGIPGAAPFALLLGALLIFGIEPGPRILTQNLDVVYVIVWSFAIASIVGAGLCFFLAKPLAKLSFIRFPLLAAAIIPILFMSGFQEPQQLPVFWVMLLVGIIGWLMKIFDVPRAPFLIGFVLALPLERYYFLTANLYEFKEWFTRPGVLIMVGILVLPLILELVRRLRSKKNPIESPSLEEDEAVTAPKSGHIYISAAFFVVFVAGFILAQSFSDAAGLFPKLATGIGAGLSIIALVVDVNKFQKAKKKGVSHDTQEWKQTLKTVAISLLWIIGYIVLVYIFGMIVGTFIFIPVFLWILAKARIRTIIIYPFIVLGFMLVLQEYGQIVMPTGYLYFGI